MNDNKAEKQRDREIFAECVKATIIKNEKAEKQRMVLQAVEDWLNDTGDDE